MRIFVLILSLITSDAVWAKATDLCEDPLTATTEKKTDGDLLEAARIWGLLEAFWAQKLGPRFRPTTLVLFTDAIPSECGFVDSGKGLVYCGADEKTYLDPSFWRELEYKHKSPGVGARVYALAHEYGHHIQNLLQVLSPTIRLVRRARKTEGLAISRLNEIWADALAGYFIREMYRTQRMSEDEIIQAVTCTGNIGDDRIYQPVELTPDCFRHGTGKQRQEGFFRGFNATTATETNPFLHSPLPEELTKRTRRKLELLYLPLKEAPPF